MILSIAHRDCTVLDRNHMPYSVDQRTFHHFNQCSKTVLDCLLDEIGLDRGRAEFLINLGAIYVNDKRRNENLPINAGDYVRAHLKPKRFPSVLPRILKIDSDYVVVDKPHGLPTHPTVDNLHENALRFCQNLLGFPLFTTHRLDTATAGLLIFARTAESQRKMNQIFSDRLVEKYYEAVVSSPVGEFSFDSTPRKLTHYMEKTERAPKLVFDEDGPNRQICLLEIISQTQITHGHLLKIKLLTGRTHQIRAQLAKINSPIVGDCDYGSEITFDDKRIALRCSEMMIKSPENNLSLSLEPWDFASFFEPQSSRFPQTTLADLQF
jgi:23S rRNA pseudouridine1911/1915/1917 synthase